MSTTTHEDRTTTPLDREQALLLWGALLPTITHPSAPRVRDLSRLVLALRNAHAVALLADGLERRAAARREGVAS